MVFTLGSSVGDDVKWQSAIDRALGTWESVVEWADYISFLSRVQKAIKGKQRCEGSKLPLAPQISEMLARCLEPSLPAGVHLTCIDVYDTVFATLGPQKLSGTMNIWLPGLLPVISWAAFNVKPLIVQLYSKYIIPAVESSPLELRELYRPMLLSFLQSIEDESSDCYSELIDLINTLKSLSTKNNDGLFWKCFYLCILTSSDSRLGALTYLQKNQPDLNEDVLFIRAVCSGLEDNNVLVQRGFLDLLAKFLPMNSRALQSNTDDFAKLMFSACSTIQRKDMSLNRRLRLWLLGPDPEVSLAPASADYEPAVSTSDSVEAGPNGVSVDSSPTNVDLQTNNESKSADATEHVTKLEKPSRLKYLQTFAADVLTEVMLDELDRDLAGTCAIAQGLMDRWEVGVTIAPALLPPVLQKAYAAGKVEAAVASFFNNVDSNIVWDTILKTIDVAPETVLFAIKSFSIQDDDMLKFYIPLTVIYILTDVESLSPAKAEIVEYLISVLPQQDMPMAPSKQLAANELRALISQAFRESVDANATDDGGDVEETLKSNDSQLRRREYISWYILKLSTNVVLVTDSAFILNRTFQLFPEAPGMEVEIPQCAELISRLNATSRNGVELFIHVVGRMTPGQIRHYVQGFVDSLYEALITNGNRQLERVRELWQIDEATDRIVVPSAISAIMANKNIEPINRARLFSGIWAHSVDQSDVSIMLTKPLLLFMDLESEDKSMFHACLQSSVVRTSTAPRLVKILVDKLDLESRGDDCVFSYVLDRFVNVLNNVDIRTAYVTKYASLACALLLEWFDKGMLPEKAYAHALELAELTILDSRIKDGRVWLRRFVDALTHAYIKRPSSSSSSSQSPSIASVKPTDESEQSSDIEVKPAIPVALVKFVAAAIPNLEHRSDIRLFIEECINRLQSEVDYEVFNQLITTLLASDPQVEHSLLKTIVTKLDSLDRPLLESDLDDIGENRGVLHLIAAIEAILATGLETTTNSTAKANNSGSNAGSLTSAITGFQVESPEDRSRAEASLRKMLDCIDIAVAECSKYWLFLQHNKISSGAFNSGDHTTALHTAGRLKTRLRKVMTLCYSFRPSETLQAVERNIEDLKLAVRLVRVFEGARVGPTLELLLNMAGYSQGRLFDFACVYIESLETDVLGDVWPILHQYLSGVAANPLTFSSPFSGGLSTLSIGGSSGSNRASPTDGEDALKSEAHTHSVLKLLTEVIIPRFDHLKSKIRKKFIREFADVYSKVLLSDLNSDHEVVGKAIQQMSIVVNEPDRQAALLGRILNSLLKSPSDIAKGADLLNVVSGTFGIAGTPTARIWTRHINDFMFETRTEKDVIPMNLEQSIKLQPVIRAWVQCDKEKVKDFMSKLPTFGSSTGVLFGWSGTQQLANANLRRLAYLTVCTPPTVLGINWSKLTSQLANMWSQNAAAVCLLLRACTLGQPNSALLAFMSYRLQAVFSDVLSRKTPVTGNDAEVLLEGCKLVDLALVIGAEQFQHFGWLFVSDNGNDIYERFADNTSLSDEASPTITEKTSEKSADGKMIEVSQRPHSRAGGILERLVGCEALPKVTFSEQLDAPTPAFKGKRRPLLPMRAKLTDLPAFLSRISVASYEEVYSMTTADREYCERWLLADLFN